jgi:hypothetical protein
VADVYLSRSAIILGDFKENATQAPVKRLIYVTINCNTHINQLYKVSTQPEAVVKDAVRGSLGPSRSFLSARITETKPHISSIIILGTQKAEVL